MLRTLLMVATAASVFCAATTARANLRVVSRNPLVFVTSTVEGEEWQAYRIVRPQQAAVYSVEGPGRVLLEIRSVLEGETDAESIAVVLDGERAVLTARIPSAIDDRANLVDQPSARRPSKMVELLVRVDAGAHRVTVRHSEGGDLLVTARFAEPLDEEPVADGELPLVSPKSKQDQLSIQNVGALANDKSELASAPTPPPAAPTTRIGEDPWRRDVAVDDEPARTQQPARDQAAVDEPHIRAAQQVAPPLTVQAPYFQFEVRGGVLFSRLALGPAPAVGADVRVAVPGLDANRWSLGVAVDLVHKTVDAIARDRTGGAPVEIVEVSQTALVAMLDLRREIYAVPDRLAVYGSLGVGGLFGTLATSLGHQRTDASLVGGLGAARLGATLGDRGHRPFAELRLLVGAVQSDLARAESGAPGDPTAYAAVGIAIGYRVTLLADIEAR